MRFQGPGTDLTVGLLPTSRFGSDTPGMQTIDGIIHAPNLPTEEVTTTPDPMRADGVVTATKPLDVAGTVVRDLQIRFETWARGRHPGRERGRAAVAHRQGRRRLAARRGRARRPRGTHREDRDDLLQHAARRERREPPRPRQRVRNARRRRGPRPHQPERDPCRLHDRQRRRHRHRTDHGRHRGAGARRSVAGNSAS